MQCSAAMDPQQFVGFCVSVLGSFAGDWAHLDAFLDSVRVLQRVCPPQHQELFLHVVKSRISGPARAFIPRNCTEVQEIVACLQQNIEADSPWALEAKLRAIAKDIRGDVDVVRFVSQAEDLVDRLVYAYIVKENQMVHAAISHAINVAATVLKVTPNVNTPREVLHKYLDRVTRGRNSWERPVDE